MIKHLDSTVANWVLITLIVVGLAAFVLLILAARFSWSKGRPYYITNSIIFFIYGVIYALIGIFMIVLTPMLIDFIGKLWNPKNFKGAYPLIEKSFKCCGYGNNSYPNQTECEATSTNCRTSVENWFSKYKLVAIAPIALGVINFVCAGFAIFFACKLPDPTVEGKSDIESPQDQYDQTQYSYSDASDQPEMRYDPNFVPAMKSPSGSVPVQNVAGNDYSYSYSNYSSGYNTSFFEDH